MIAIGFLCRKIFEYEVPETVMTKVVEYIFRNQPTPWVAHYRKLEVAGKRIDVQMAEPQVFIRGKVS